MTKGEMRSWQEEIREKNEGKNRTARKRGRWNQQRAVYSIFRASWHGKSYPTSLTYHFTQFIFQTFQQLLPVPLGRTPECLDGCLEVYLQIDILRGDWRSGDRASTWRHFRGIILLNKCTKSVTYSVVRSRSIRLG